MFHDPKLSSLFLDVGSTLYKTSNIRSQSAVPCLEAATSAIRQPISIKIGDLSRPEKQVLWIINTCQVENAANTSFLMSQPPTRWLPFQNSDDNWFWPGNFHPFTDSQSIEVLDHRELKSPEEVAEQASTHSPESRERSNSVGDHYYDTDPAVVLTESLGLVSRSPFILNSPGPRFRSTYSSPYSNNSSQPMVIGCIPKTPSKSTCSQLSSPSPPPPPPPPPPQVWSSYHNFTRTC